MKPMPMYWVTMEGLAALARQGRLDEVELEPAKPLPPKARTKPSKRKPRK